MTTIRQLIHSSPKRANELFAKLVDTSETAIRTNRRLARDVEGAATTVRALFQIAMIKLMSRRLARFQHF